MLWEWQISFTEHLLWSKHLTYIIYKLSYYPVRGILASHFTDEKLRLSSMKYSRPHNSSGANPSKPPAQVCLILESAPSTSKPDCLFAKKSPPRFKSCDHPTASKLHCLWPSPPIKWGCCLTLICKSIKNGKILNAMWYSASDSGTAKGH